MDVVVVVDNFRFQGKNYKKGESVFGLPPELIDANLELKTIAIKKPEMEKETVGKKAELKKPEKKGKKR